MRAVFRLAILILIILTGCNFKTSTRSTSNFETNFSLINIFENTLTSMITSPHPDIPPIDLDNNNLLDNITEFCISPRKAGTLEEDKAVDFLVSKMSEYGYNTTIQAFNTYEKNMSEIWGISSLEDYFYKFTGDDNASYQSKNVIVTNSVEGAEKTLYLTAHYDTEKNIHGIRDNGSGVTVLLEIALQLRNRNLPINITFVFLGAEECGLQGSTNFVAQLSQIEIDNALGCINIDTVGSTEDTKVSLWTCNSEINALSLQMDKLHHFAKKNTLYSDHMGSKGGNSLKNYCLLIMVLILLY